MMQPKNTFENRAIAATLRKVNQCQWVGNLVFDTLEKALASINYNSNNSGWYTPVCVQLASVPGYHMLNESGSIFFEYRIIKESDNKFRTETLTNAGYNSFEKLFREYDE